MEYELVEISSKDGDSLGYGIKKVGLDKLTSVNVFSYEEASEQVNDLNERARLTQFWPDPNDPDVQALVNDPEFDPVEYDQVRVPDLERSTIVYDMKPGPAIINPMGLVTGYGDEEVKYDETGQPSINWMASDIVYKIELQPKRTQGKGRFELACEQVARRRMERADA